MRALLVSLVMVFSTGCATIMHGTAEDIGLSSTPTNARVMVDNHEVGKTPTVVKLSRKDNHIVRMELDGYQPFEATITRGTSGWVWGNLVFGGLIGLVVDATSGGLYKLTPEQIAGQLAKQGALVTPRRDGIYVAVVLHADKGWQRIGAVARQ